MVKAAKPLSRTQCLARLSSRRAGRVSVSRKALPVIMPVTYECDGTHLVLTAPLDADFADVCDRAVLAFEVGSVGVDDAGWSIHVVGLGEAQQDRTVWVDLERMTGRQGRSDTRAG
jgi:Pyridoxamine 5'-phosphate oxidase